jgi:hypothetical protein
MTDTRPNEIGVWMKTRCLWIDIPIANIDSCTIAWWSWWVALQPEERKQCVVGNDANLLTMPTIDMDWKKLRKRGKNGLSLVMVTLIWYNHQRASHHKIDYLRYEAILYRHWANERMAPIWIVNLQIDSIREEYPSSQVKLPAGSLLHLHDSDLAMNSLGFKHHAALGMILEGGWGEPGFHIFPFETHFYTCKLHSPTNPDGVHQES